MESYERSYKVCESCKAEISANKPGWVLIDEQFTTKDWVQKHWFCSLGHLIEWAGQKKE